MTSFITLHIPTRESPENVAAHLTEIIRLVGFMNGGSSELQAWLYDTYGRGPTRSIVFEVDPHNMRVTTGYSSGSSMAQSIFNRIINTPIPISSVPHTASRRRMTYPVVQTTPVQPPVREPRRPRANETPCGDCTICLDKIYPSQTVTALPCAHRFHSACVEGWLRNNNTCPLCRSNVNMS